MTQAFRRPGGRARRRPAAMVLLYVVLLAGVVLSLWPFYWMVLTSFRGYADFYTWPPELLPVNLTRENYRALFGLEGGLVYGKWTMAASTPFHRSAVNSFIIASASTLLGLLFSSMAGFAFAKYDFPGRETLFVVLLATMMLPQFVILIPLFVMMSRLHLINTYAGVILPSCASAFGILWLRQYMSSLPSELLDAAIIDGASHYRVYWRIFLPLSKPALSALGFLLFMGQWNDFLWPLVMLTSERMYTIPIFLQNLQRMVEMPPYPLIMAGSTIAVIPLLIGFAIMQEQFIAGLTAGALG